MIAAGWAHGRMWISFSRKADPKKFASGFACP